jgi:hypothetical protein
MFVLNETKKGFYRWLLGGRLVWAMCCTVIYRMSYVLPIDGYCISRLFTYAWDEACAPHLFIQDGLYVQDEHVFLGYLPKMSYVLSIDRSVISWLFTQMRHMYLTSYVFQCYLPRMSYVLPIDGSCISQLFNQDEPYVWDEPCVLQLFTQDKLCAPYRCVLYLLVIYPGSTICMRRAMCSMVIYPRWAMCSRSMGRMSRMSHGYLPRMSYVLPIDGCCVSRLFAHAEPYVWDEPCVPQLFILKELFHIDGSCISWLFTQYELCAPYGCVH